MDSLEKINLESQLLDIYKHVFIETGFSKRFSEVINTSRRKKDILVIGAHPRNGKSWCVRDLVLNSGRYKSYDGKTYLPIIAIQAPDSKNSNQIVRDMCRCFGKFKLSTIDDMKNWLIDNIPVFGVEQLIIDDAHELNQDHFKFIKWFNDKLILEKNYDISIVFVSIMGNNKITTWQKLSQYQGETWTQQLYERFSVPYQVYGLSPEEVTQVLFDYEGIYTDFMPKIQLIQYS
ncbi:ATP-binding protein, partial [Ruminiclostridium cellobioparum]|uniref:ATP-binding protein n=1 Tax=Ruminiclostridium cellobioparum TaxID=29355 RepID=UPI0028A6A207